MKKTLRMATALALLLGPWVPASAEVVATVGGEKIDDVELNAKTLAEEKNANRALNADEKQAILQALINQRLLVASARSAGLHKKDEVRRTIDDAERQLLSNLIYEKEVASKVIVTDSEVKEFFEKNPQLFELRQVSQILVQPLSAEKAASAEREAKRLKAQVAASPNSFAETAKTESDDTISREKGGDLGQLRRGTMLKELEDAVFAAKPGSIVGPVKTQFGFHILYVKNSKKQNFDEARDVIRREIGRARAGELQQKLLDELNKKYKVSINKGK